MRARLNKGSQDLDLWCPYVIGGYCEVLSADNEYDELPLPFGFAPLTRAELFRPIARALGVRIGAH